MRKQAMVCIVMVLCVLLVACVSKTPAQQLLAFESEALRIYPGETVQLEYLAPENTQVAFSSSDSAVLTVDQNGCVTGVASGTATVIASTGEYDKAYLEIVVEKDVLIAQTDISLDVGQVELIAGTKYDFPVTVQKGGEIVVNPEITWTSSDETVATVENGCVQTVAPGETVISATISVDGAPVSSQCVVKVYEYYRIELDQKKIEAPIGKEFALHASIYDADGNAIIPAEEELELITSNPTTISVRENSFKVISIGTASVGVRYRGNVASIPVDIFSVKADFFKSTAADFYGEVSGETFSGVVFKSTSYQPFFYFSDAGIQQIWEYAQKNGYSTLRMHTYPILKNNNYRINGRYVGNHRWTVTDVPLSELDEDFWFQSESEGTTEVYMWFEFR